MVMSAARICVSPVTMQEIVAGLLSIFNLYSLQMCMITSKQMFYILSFS